MDRSELFWTCTPEALARGFVRNDTRWVCLLCGETREQGRVYPEEDGALYDAEASLRRHIVSTHKSVFEALLGMDKKLTGLTEHQKSLLRCFHRGASDEEIQRELQIGSLSTIRNHRFQMKQKERQAKLLLTLMQLIDERPLESLAEATSEYVPISPTARCVDERYDLTQSEYDAIIRKYMPEGVLTGFEMQEKHKLAVLRQIAQLLEYGREYAEKEITAILKEVYDPDPVILRRYLIEYGFMQRVADGSRYWRI